MARLGKALLLAALLPLGLAGCENAKRELYTGGMTLGGQDVTAETLNTGHEAYMHYCNACHGEEGDGNGPAALGYRPPPRDFRTGVYKFTGVVDGLPRDEDLARLIRNGLNGTPMLPWEIPEAQIDPLVQYTKTFSELWQDPDEEIGDPVLPEGDPWVGRDDEAARRGSAVYHGFATCWSCHPAYETKQDIFEASKEWRKGGITDFRKDLYRGELKESEFRVGETKMKILPPDFIWHPVRSVWEGTEVNDLFRTIGSGIPGTAMPQWYGSIPDDDLWAMAYYVKALMDARGTPDAIALRRRLDKQPAFVPPAPEPEPEPEPEEPAEGAEGQEGDAAGDDEKGDEDKKGDEGKKADEDKPKKKPKDDGDSKSDKPKKKKPKDDGGDEPKKKPAKKDTKDDAKGDAKGDG